MAPAPASFEARWSAIVRISDAETAFAAMAELAESVRFSAQAQASVEGLQAALRQRPEGERTQWCQARWRLLPSRAIAAIIPYLPPPLRVEAIADLSPHEHVLFFSGLDRDAMVKALYPILADPQRGASVLAAAAAHADAFHRRALLKLPLFPMERLASVLFSADTRVSPPQVQAWLESASPVQRKRLTELQHHLQDAFGAPARAASG